MRLIFWFLVAANICLLVLRYGVGVPVMFQKPPPSIVSVSPQLQSAARIVLLGELGGDDVGQTGVASEVRQGSKSFCRAVGPFGASDMARDFVARLAALDVRSKVQSRGMAVGFEYWVYLESLGTRKKARQQLAELKAQGMDSYIIPKGALANGISLGVYRQMSLAEERIDELKSMGLTAKVQNIERSYQEVWVVLGVGEDQKIGAFAWKTLLDGDNHLKEQQNVCLDVDYQ